MVFQLKAGKFEHVPLIRLSNVASHFGRRCPDVAAHLAGDAGLSQDVAGERGGGGFAVGAGDAAMVRPSRQGRQFQFADDGNAASRMRASSRRSAARREKARSDRRPENACVGLRQDGHARHFAQRFFVHGADLAPPWRCRNFNAATPERAMPTTTIVSGLKVADHLSFRVVSANSAITNPAIQNRVMIFDSCHPSCSKW